MARTVTEIQNEMLTAIANNAVLSVLATSASATAVFRLLTYIVALAIFTLEGLFDTHKQEVTTMIFEQKSGRLQWYKTIALAFQYGFDLVPDMDFYDNTGYTDEEIENSKIVKYAAVGESDTESRVIIKIAGETAGELAPLTVAQKAAFDAYMKEVKWPGRLTVINYLPDRLYLGLKIEYDALVLSNTGQSILNANYPVQDAISAFLKDLPFNGQLRLSALIDRLQATEGVIDATLLSAETSFIDPVAGEYGAPVAINISAIPESGYFTIEELNIEYYT